MFKQIHACISLLKCIKNKPMVVAMAMMMLIPSASYLKASPIAGNETETAMQPITVTGKVVDQEGIALPGVYVVLQGTNTGVVTDANGNYSIQVPSADASLEFSYIGFLKETVAVAGQSVVDVTLMADVTALEEVVVIGYGTQRKEAVTGSVASVDADIIQDIPAANITQSLQGRISGVEMSQVSTKPGSAMQVRIRGIRSVNATNDPLVVLDGIPFGGNIGDINPNDIKSIDILKDASATAIYGSRGANGVILVTTNKGTKGQKAQVSYNGYYGLKKVFAPYPMMNAAEFSALRDAAGIYETDGLHEDRSLDTDWQDLFYRNGSVNNHDLTISGGTETGAYSFSAGYLNEKAVIPSQGYNRMSIRGSLDQEVGDFFKFGFSTNNSYSTNTGNQVGLYGVLSMSPIVNPYNDDGSLRRIVSMPLDDQFVWTKDVIEDLEDQYLDESKRFATYNNLYGEIKIPGIEGLKYRLNLGLNFIQNNTGAYTGRGVGSVNEETESTASISNSHHYNWAVENLLTYDRLFAGKHQINIVALYSAEQTKYNRSSVAAKDIPTDAFQFYNLGNA
ncbi:MAG: SusC/RagA family TonB-linked outer membrane protein, partial [Bacteroidales bacterium]|nr:SusC/RagA family TonB-linked outer membrane protein [Bacteroidales bacterium]